MSKVNTKTKKNPEVECLGYITFEDFKGFCCINTQKKWGKMNNLFMVNKGNGTNSDVRDRVEEIER